MNAAMSSANWNWPPGAPGVACAQASGIKARSEEHTSELQSQSNLVCRLLLEKKKKGLMSTVAYGNCLDRMEHAVRDCHRLAVSYAVDESLSLGALSGRAQFLRCAVPWTCARL